MAEPLLKYPLRAFLDLSTAHLTLETRGWLHRQGMETSYYCDGQEEFPQRGGLWPSRWVALSPFGWFVYADAEPIEHEFPADLIACMKKARELGAEYILFDADADPGTAPEGLPTYEET